jgi:hypothetical protein
MESGFGEQLEGFLIKGNLSLIPSLYQEYNGDGSIEAAGKLYVNTIEKYNALLDNSIFINKVQLHDDYVYVPHTRRSTDTSASFIIDGGITVRGNHQATSSTDGGGLTVLGGVGIKDTLYVGSYIDVNDHRIKRVDYPVDQSDAANKQYVDDRAGDVRGNFTTGQVIIAESTGDAIRGVDNFTFDTASSTLTISGPSGGSLNLTGGQIYNVGPPLLDSNVATKEYVDGLIADVSENGITGQFSSGQVIIGGEQGVGLLGYDTFTYSNGNVIVGGPAQLLITNTSNAYSLGTRGALIVDGGAILNKNVFIGGELDVNYSNIKHVATPIEDYDAVNKAYIDKLVGDCGCSCGEEPVYYETEYVLSNSQFQPVDLVSIENKKVVFSEATRCFVSYIYLQNTQNNKYTLYTVRGINRGVGWYLSSNFIGDISDLDFYIRTDTETGEGYLQYTNFTTDSSTTVAKFRTSAMIKETAPTQIQQVLENNTGNAFRNLTALKFYNNTLHSAKVILHITDATNNKHGMYFMNCILRDNKWAMNTYSLGNVTGVQFIMVQEFDGEEDFGQIRYRNTNTGGEYIIRAKTIPLRKSQDEIVLTANTTVSTAIDLETFTYDADDRKTFQDTLFVSVPDTSVNKHAVYEIEGIYGDGRWRLNTRFIGDKLDIYFNITAEGVLQYRNLYNTDAIVKYIRDTPPVCEPLPVPKGGTGNKKFVQNAVLRGDGENPIIGTEDFIYENYKLVLGQDSSIVLLNSAPAVTTTSGGTLITYGGIGIDKNLIVGQSLAVKGVDMTPSGGDIWAERRFDADNGVFTPQDVTGFDLSAVNVKSFTGVACVTVFMDNEDEQYDTLYEIKALRKKSGWTMNTTFIGDTHDFEFTITSEGQIQYTSPLFPDWTETVVKFRGLATSLP